MPHYTITNVPPSDPSMLAEWATLVTAIGGVVTILVWPILIGIVAWMYRDPISELIPKLSSIEAPGIKAQTHTLVDATEALEERTAAEASASEDIAHSAPQPPTSPPADENAEDTDGAPATNAAGAVTSRGGDDALPAAAAQLSGHLDSQMSSRFSQVYALLTEMGYPGTAERTFDDLVRVHPPSAIVFAWGEVEERLRLLARVTGLKNVDRMGSVRQIANRLYDQRLIPSELHNLLREMLPLRNAAAHARHMNINAAEAIEFNRSAGAVVRELNRLIGDIESGVSVP